MIRGGAPLPRRRARRAASTAALCVLVAASVLSSCSSSEDGGSDTTTTTAADVTTTTALRGTLTPTEAVIAGQCLDPLPDPQQQTYAVLVLPCEDPHVYEVYAQATIALGEGVATGKGAAYPGGLAVSNAAEAQCVSAFDQFMGIRWEESEYDIQTWWPSEQSWATKNDRTVLCAVYRVTGGTTKGSVRGSKQ